MIDMHHLTHVVKGHPFLLKAYILVCIGELDLILTHFVIYRLRSLSVRLPVYRHFGFS